jgi:hypothetical protein
VIACSMPSLNGFVASIDMSRGHHYNVCASSWIHEAINIYQAEGIGAATFSFQMGSIMMHICANRSTSAVSNLLLNKIQMDMLINMHAHSSL